MKVNIAILNYNGKALLEECLPSILEAASSSSYDVKVTVLDNCSTDNSVDYLKKSFPQIEIYAARENKVYCSYNEFFDSIDDDVIFILNSDIKVDRKFIDPVIKHFEEEDDVFFVSSKMYYFDGVTYQGDLSRAVERFGTISADSRFEGYKTILDKKGYTFSTGNGAFDRKKFLLLKGFDEIYLPGRYEDVDLCYRAWKSGYKAFYEPASIIYHKGYASFKEVYSDRDIQKTVFRNSILFMVKNFTDTRILVKFYLFLVPRLAGFLLTGRIYFIKGFLQAVRGSKQAFKNKRAAAATFKLSDREVLAKVGCSNG